MTVVSATEESERRLAEAMRAQATGVGRPGFVGRHPGWSAAASGPSVPLSHNSGGGSTAGPTPAAPGRTTLRAALVGTRVALLLALVGGVVVGVVLALVSLLAPGVLPPLG